MRTILHVVLLSLLSLAACSLPNPGGWLAGDASASDDDGGVSITLEPPGDDPPPDVDASAPAIDDPADADASSPTTPLAEAGPSNPCVTALAPGDLAIEEMMIESVSGSGDHGEWIEIASRRTCAINLRGLRGDCPVGAKVATFEVTGDVWLPPFGTFVVADSLDPVIDHALVGILVGWDGEPGDVLRNQGATLTLRYGTAIVDSLTYPKLALAPGTSLAFPSSCSSHVRSDWSKWRASTSSWFPGFRGTPNAPNADVVCP